MEDQKSNVRVILSDKAEIVLEDILKNFNLEEKNVVADRLLKDFARETLSEKDFISALQKEMTITSEISEKLAKEITVKLVPLLLKVPEEKFNDPDFREEISQKIFEKDIKTSITSAQEKKDPDIFPNIKPLESVTDKSVVPPKKSGRPERIKKSVAKEEVKKEEIKKPAPQAKPRSGPDNYREPIE
jgi:hypothetical protein